MPDITGGQTIKKRSRPPNRHHSLCLGDNYRYVHVSQLKRGLVTDGSPPDWPYWTKLNTILETKNLPGPAVMEESVVDNTDG